MKPTTTILIALALAAGWVVCGAQPSQAAPSASSIRFSTSPVPVGSGARALGMGGAFVAVADDATAASWNPGGLFQLEKPEFSMVYGWTLRSEDYHSSSVSDFNVNTDVSSDKLNYVSAVYPFHLLGRNMVISINYQRLYEMNKDLKFDMDTDIPVGNGVATVNTKFNVLREGSLKTLSPAYALQITPTLALGATFNIWNELGSIAENGWRERTNIRLSGATEGGAPIDQVTIEEHLYENFRGFNMNLGFLWDPHPVFTLGGVFKTPMISNDVTNPFGGTASVDHRFLRVTTAGGQPAATPKGAKESLEIKWPWSVGLGAAARVNDNLTLSFDGTWTEWKKFLLETCDDTGACVMTNPISGQPADEADLQATLQLRLGMEYLIILKKTVVPLRLGLFADPEPAPGSPEKIYGWSLGTGFSWEDYFDSGMDMIFDLAWQARVGRDLNGGLSGIPGAKMDLFQNLLLLSVIHHF